MKNELQDLVFMPALIVILLNKERAKGSPLTESEVITIRDSATCMIMPRSIAQKMIQERGYDDLDPEQVWTEWSKARLALTPSI